MNDPSDPPYFVKRRVGDTFVSTLCHSLEEAWSKADDLHLAGYSEVWIEDENGNPIEEKGRSART
jgi:hypothetical protein